MAQNGAPAAAATNATAAHNNIIRASPRTLRPGRSHGAGVPGGQQVPVRAGRTGSRFPSARVPSSTRRAPARRASGSLSARRAPGQLPRAHHRRQRKEQREANAHDRHEKHVVQPARPDDGVAEQPAEPGREPTAERFHAQCPSKRWGAPPIGRVRPQWIPRLTVNSCQSARCSPGQSGCLAGRRSGPVPGRGRVRDGVRAPDWSIRTRIAGALRGPLRFRFRIRQPKAGNGSAQRRGRRLRLGSHTCNASPAFWKLIEARRKEPTLSADEIERRFK